MEKDGLSGFLLGLGLGVGLGLLFAPKSGEETRRYIKDKSGEGADFVKQRGTEFKQSAAEWVDKGKEVVSKQKDNLTEAVSAGRQAYRDATAPDGSAN